VTFGELVQRALAVRSLYAAFEQRNYGASWTTEELALGLVGDVGDLAKLILAHEGRRHIPEAEEKLAHELADCLWALMVLADACDVDLEHAFLHTMADLEQHLTGASG
jgi:NTP pyrophosphatase (non-canonical NTP hydrolase)